MWRERRASRLLAAGDEGGGEHRVLDLGAREVDGAEGVERGGRDGRCRARTSTCCQICRRAAASGRGKSRTWRIRRMNAGSMLAFLLLASTATPAKSSSSCRR